ncbi:MAG TPA: hypothetical protein VFU13_20310 [Steroidobacteraceae bacterium]|nr:hypothetical protein [Steroidobacteraceae bacterium]
MKRTSKLLFSTDDATAVRSVVPPSSITRHVPRHRRIVLALLVTAVFLSATWLAFAAGDDHASVWRGRTDRDQVAVTLTLVSSDDAKLAFGSPRFCTLTARLESEHVYTLRNSNGGYCDRLLGGFMQLTADADTRRLKVQLTDDRGAVRDSAELTAAKTDEQTPN